MPYLKHRVQPVTDTTDTEYVATVVQASPESAPTTSSHGIDCTGYELAGLQLDVNSTTAYTCKVYVYDGTSWTELGEDDEITGTTRDITKVLNVAPFARVAARLTSVTGTSVTRRLTLV